MNEENYRREEDRKWRESVEARLVSLTSAQKTTDDDLDKQMARLNELDELLEGDPLKRDDSGLKGDVSELNRAVNALRAIMAPDALGHGGVKNRLDACEDALGLKVQTSKYRWLVVLGIISASSAVTVALVENLDRIASVYAHLTHATKTPPSHSKRSGNKRRHKEAPPPEDSSDEATEPEVQK